MRKAYTFLILGIWLAVLPYLGFPYSWKNILETISGFWLIYVSFVVYKESKSRMAKNEAQRFDNFSENNNEKFF